MDCAASGKEQPYAPVYAGGYPAGKELHRERPGHHGGYQIEHEAMVSPCHKEG